MNLNRLRKMEAIKSLARKLKAATEERERLNNEMEAQIAECKSYLQTNI